jgi:predicted nucleic acid-binding protein
LKTRVLDSWPIVEWIKETQPAADTVDRLFAEASSGTVHLLMSAINAGEVYYYLRKYQGEALAESWRNSSRTLPITIEVPSGDEIWDAAFIKGQYPISYADAFAAALAHKHRCALVTGDPEFRAVADLELDWIGRAAN